MGEGDFEQSFRENGLRLGWVRWVDRCHRVRGEGTGGMVKYVVGYLG